MCLFLLSFSRSLSSRPSFSLSLAFFPTHKKQSHSALTHPILPFIHLPESPVVVCSRVDSRIPEQDTQNFQMSISRGPLRTKVSVRAGIRPPILKQHTSNRGVPTCACSAEHPVIVQVNPAFIGFLGSGAGAECGHNIGATRSSGTVQCR